MIPGVLGQQIITAEEILSGELAGTISLTFTTTANLAPTDDYATLDGATTNVTMSNGDLTATHNTATSNSGVRSTSLKDTGKYYVEFTATDVDGNSDGCGIITAAATVTDYVSSGINCSIVYKANGDIFSNDGSAGFSLGAIADGNIIGMAADFDNDKVWFRKAPSGNWNGNVSHDPATNTGGVSISNYTASQMCLAVGFGGTGTQLNDVWTGNFGQGAFSGTVPSGFTSGWPLLALGELAGTATLMFTPAATLAGTTTLSGAAALTFTPAADLLALGEGELTGTTALTFTPAAILSGAFTPTDLGGDLELWYDASDTSSITATGGLVSQFNDKSGNGNHLSGAAPGEPTTGANTLNSLNVLTFAGTNDRLDRTGSVTIAALHQSGATMVVVRKYTASGSQGLFWTHTQSGSSGDNCSMGREGTATGIWGNGTTSSAGLAAAYTDTNNTDWQINSGVFTSTTSREIFEDGTSKASSSGNSSGLTSPITGIALGLNLSANRGAAQFLTGQIAEAILVVGSGATNRQKLEGYVAWKWGLQANLPGGHPYAGASP